MFRSYLYNISLRLPPLLFFPSLLNILRCPTSASSNYLRLLAFPSTHIIRQIPPVFISSTLFPRFRGSPLQPFIIYSDNWMSPNKLLLFWCHLPLLREWPCSLLKQYRLHYALAYSNDVGDRDQLFSYKKRMYSHSEECVLLISYQSQYEVIITYLILSGWSRALNVDWHEHGTYKAIFLE